MKKTLLRSTLIIALPLLALGCDTTPQTTVTEDAPDPTTEEIAGGTLEVFANAEERPQVGFTSRDGWDLSFDNLYVNFSEIKAYQTEPPYDYTSLAPIQDAMTEVSFDPQSVDLVTGDEADPTVFLGSQSDVPEGHYNAISYYITPATDGPGEGYGIVIIGTAERDGETVDFVLNLEQELNYYCGEYIGDERRGILAAGDEASLEATLHLDHLFGEGSKPADDPLNQTAFGFAPLAALATDGRVEANMAMLQAELSAEDYARLESSLVELGHAGEGHCFEANSGLTS
ncbi:MAG: DUF4382 domain-containing protein [Nodosilinea sp.]